MKDYQVAVKSKQLEENLLKLLETYSKLIEVKDKITNFVESNRKYKYILSRKIFVEMKINQSNYAEVMNVVTSEYDSVITIQTAYRIKSRKLYDYFKNDFNKLNKSINIESISDFNFIISFKNIKGITFLVSGEAFIFFFR